MFSRLISTALALGCASLTVAYAQVGITPYSTQGIGNLTRPGLVHNHSMGGVGVGTGSGFNINYANPAMLYKNTLSSFDVAFSFERTTQRRNDESAVINQGGINYGVFAFPIIANRWSAALGMMPYSTVGYRQEEDLVGGANDPAARRVREGSGGLNLVSFSHGVRIYKNLAIGVRLGYLFGGINETRSIFLTSTSGLTSVYEDQLYYSDVLIEPSIYFGQKIGQRTSLNLGVVYQPATRVRATKDITFSSQVPGAGSPVPGQDIVDAQPGEVRLPEKLSAGLSIDQYLKYTIGVDVSYQAWEEFESYETGQNEGMQNSFALAAGGQYIPNASSVNSYLARVAYRLGGHYRNLPFAVGEQQISEFGIDFGLSLPVSNLSSINLAFEIGNRGTTDRGLIRENYARATLGVTFNDRWFIRRKFD
jgi:hypothetical protein